MIRLALALLLLGTGLAHAQETVDAAQASGAKLRGLDKLNGEVVDFDLNVGYAIRFGSLMINLADCRYPSENPTGDAYAYLLINEEAEDEAPQVDASADDSDTSQDTDPDADSDAGSQGETPPAPPEDKEVFRGWMVASSPALNALDHFRYDVWVLRCITSEPEEGSSD